jgi:hypothetical protein
MLNTLRRIAVLLVPAAIVIATAAPRINFR